jgi:hypothetical protein
VKTRAEWYREKAAECDRLSLESHEPIVQEALAFIAKKWRDLASEVAQLDQK